VATPSLLLDTHVLAWWLLDSPRLGALARAAIADPGHLILISTVSVWEMAQKHGRGRWPEVGPGLATIEADLARLDFRVLPLTLAHALAAGALDWAHRDPFDRMLAAQALAEGATLVTADRVFATVAPASGLALMAA
jgi:PIN domain nuclease of toxin-antitoxin system